MKKKKIVRIISIIVAIIAVIAIAFGIYCGVSKQNPKEAATSIFASDETNLVGKWDSVSSPGLSAYVFYEDGTYDSYLSTVNFSGKYTVKGKKITLVNPDTNKEITYKFKVTGKKLTMNLVKDGKVSKEDSDTFTFNKVDELDMKTLSDLVGELASDKNSTTTTEKD